MQKLTVNTKKVQPSMPALAPRAISEACSEFPKCPVIITDSAITAGKVAKIPANYFEGVSCSMIKQIATDAPPNKNLRPRSRKSNLVVYILMIHPISIV
jgi:hypothetical protein